MRILIAFLGKVNKNTFYSFYFYLDDTGVCIFKLFIIEFRKCPLQICHRQNCVCFKEQHECGVIENP